MITPTEEQQSALEYIKDQLASGARIVELAGAAGTGKTTMLLLLAQSLPSLKVLFVAPTNKAVLVLQNKGCKNARTIHSTIYMPVSRDAEEAELKEVEKKLRKANDLLEIDKLKARAHELVRIIDNVRFTMRDPNREDGDGFRLADYHLIVLDEASMVDRVEGELLAAIRISSFAPDGCPRYTEDGAVEKKPIPLVAVGDPNQLPPVGDPDGNPPRKGEPYYFTRDDVPRFTLSRIQRQAAGNPIIRLAHHIVAKQPLKSFPSRLHAETVAEDGTLGDLFIANPNFRPDDELEQGPWDVEITWMRKTRATRNRAIRRLLGRSAMPVAGDRLILEKSYRGVDIYGPLNAFGDRPRIHLRNGELVTLIAVSWDMAAAQLDPDTYGAYAEFKIRREDGTTPTVTANMVLLDPHADDTGWSPSDAEIEAERQFGVRIERSGAKFGYAYALTCHKAQGSEWNSVLIHFEVPKVADAIKQAPKWLYTAVTRARIRCGVLYAGLAHERPPTIGEMLLG